MHSFPFAQLSATFAPGSSYYISNAAIIFKRVALGLQDPVRIQIDEKGNHGPLYDWYRLHPQGIRSMQHRKEVQAPFYHEYVTFSLDDGSCFRIDRRQLPNEQSPIECTEDQGVEAYDTIEQIRSLDDSMYNPSICLIHLDFAKAKVGTPHLFQILRAICKHPVARVYTIQRYNCYFYAHTIILLFLNWASCWDSDCFWDEAEPAIRQSQLLAFIRDLLQIDIKILINPAASDSGRTTEPKPERPSGGSRRFGNWKNPLKKARAKQSSNQRSTMNELTMHEVQVEGLQKLSSAMIRVHARQVEEYKFVLHCSALQIERDMKTTISDIWRQAFPRHYREIRKRRLLKGLKIRVRRGYEIVDNWYCVMYDTVYGTTLANPIYPAPTRHPTQTNSLLTSFRPEPHTCFVYPSSFNEPCNHIMLPTCHHPECNTPAPYFVTTPGCLQPPARTKRSVDLLGAVKFLLAS
ncbi:hypothetical protein RSOLAG1IB_08413 [Rhizoctonia solani AG-1 IB]|uniref:Uncharacterized protein n=1 Tax=Thanatephorus cucumeris (strain AG1-IB / isolate 7/3/14) TaxID=1108050 RepID=A0A0B7FHR5_THACB|nr:hypothetical protein RSOLAG1IB_08413 [Rhizoctonia solani AG-1 IB]